MLDITLVVLCAGDSSRFVHSAKKQWLRMDNEPLWLSVTNRLSGYANFSKILIISHKDEISYMKNFTDDFIFIEGGNSRQESMINSLEHIDTKYVMFTDVARACIPKDVILRIIENKENADCIVPILDITDTVIYKQETINRDETKLIQTPQLSKTKVLKKALNTNSEFTDDSSAIKSIGGSVSYVQGSTSSKKLTLGDEIYELSCLKPPSKNFFTGIGVDIHQFEENKKLFLGGVHVPCEYGFKAHSDGDVLIHSLIDALLGSIGAGDIGEFFPDTDEQYKGVDSKILLDKIVTFVYNVGYEIINIDLTILAQKPKISPYKMEIKSMLSKLIGIKKQFINVKASTGEKIGFVGRSEGVVVYSTATLKYYNWNKNEYTNN